MITTKWVLIGAAAGLALAAAGCSSSHHSASGSTSTTVAASAPATTAATGAAGGTTSGVAPSSTDPPGSTAPTTVPPVTAPPASGPGRCATAALRGSLTNSNGTAGSVYYSLVLVNTGSSPCILQGYPGVSFVTGTQGKQVGAAAQRISESAPSVTLAPSGSASAVLQITDATAYGPACGLTPTDGLRVYPPNQLAALFVAHSDRGCTNTHDVILHVGAFQTGTSG